MVVRSINVSEFHRFPAVRPVQELNPGAELSGLTEIGRRVPVQYFMGLPGCLKRVNFLFVFVFLFKQGVAEKCN